MSLTAYVGTAGSGKTTKLIREMQAAKAAGREVALILCSDSPDLRARPHVKAGGLMGCRTPGVNFEITHFVSADQAADVLDAMDEGAVAAFDEASWFGTGLVDSWVRASERGVDVYVSSLSEDQIDLLVKEGFSMTTVSTPCALCGVGAAAVTIIAEQTTEQIELRVCEPCNNAIERNKDGRSNADAVLADLYEIKPFPGEYRSYQPLYQVEADGWDFVRLDSPERADLMLQAYTEFYGEPSGKPTYLDLGCATGFFCEFMDDHGFTSTGVDIDDDFMRVAGSVSKLRQSSVEYIKSDALSYVRANPDQQFDVVSTFATVQWVMAQSGLEAGLECFDWIFKAAQQMCVVEIGYSKEDIYSENLPVRVDRTWMQETMRERGGFDRVLFYEASQHNTWRDQFIGIRGAAGPGDDGLTVDGAGRRVGAADGMWDDSWSGARLAFSVAVDTDAPTVRLTGMVPEFMDEPARIRMTSGPNQSEVECQPGAAFEIASGTDAVADDVVRVTIESDRAQQPPNDDMRYLAFHLRTVSVG